MTHATVVRYLALEWYSRFALYYETESRLPITLRQSDDPSPFCTVRTNPKYELADYSQLKTQLHEMTADMRYCRSVIVHRNKTRR